MNNTCFVQYRMSRALAPVTKVYTFGEVVQYKHRLIIAVRCCGSLWKGRRFTVHCRKFKQSDSWARHKHSHSPAAAKYSTENTPLKNCARVRTFYKFTRYICFLLDIKNNFSCFNIVSLSGIHKRLRHHDKCLLV